MADFKLGRIKFKWRGDWAASTAYLVDDIIKYGANCYVVLTNHTSQAVVANFYTDLSAGKYSLHTEGLFFKGDWAGSTFYKLNDLAKNGAYQYRCKLQHTSASTFAIGSNWEVYGEGLQFEDNYASGTTYQDGDVVTYGGYSYVYVNATPSAGNTPTDNSYWDVLTTGFKALGAYAHGTTYKTGDTIQYGGNNYVCTANHASQYPANTNGTTNTSYWTLNLEGFNYRAAYNASTVYNIGDVVRLTSSTYVAIQDRIQNVSPDSDAAKWQIIAQGDTGAVLSTRGDLIRQGAAASARLPIGTVGSVLTTDGTDPSWSNPEGANVKYVANSGSDSNPGTQFLPYKTVYYALSQATSGDVVAFDTVAGGTGGTPGTYDLEQTASNGPGVGAKIRVIIDGSSTPTVTIITGGSGHVVGNSLTFGNIALDGSTVQGGGMSNITLVVVSASVGDVVYIKNGVYRETLPIRVPAGVTVQGESLRGTEIRPASGTGHQIKTVTTSDSLSGTTPGTFKFIHSTTASGSGDGAVFNVTIASNNVTAISVYNGGYGFVVGDTVTMSTSQLVCGGTGSVTVTVASLENNDASNMFLCNNQTNIVQMSMKGLTGTPGAGATGKAAVVSLDPSGSITTASPYIQNCSSVNGTATGVQIDGLLHSGGNKSILCNDYTQINSDGKGVHALGGGRGEMVSVFTYYNAISFHAESGGFIRGLNCSSGYGEQGAVADGTLATETAVTVAGLGQMLKYATAGFIAAATESDVADTVSTSGTPTAATITGTVSGASATISRVNISLDFLHIESITGNFNQGEICTVQKDDSSTYQLTLDASFGDSSAANQGQEGPLIRVDGSALSSATAIKVGTNVVFAGDTAKYYRISAVSETNTTAETAVIRLTESITTARAVADNEAGSITANFSNIRLTGHDFLNIGTGDFTTTNYPGSESQPPDQADEVNETAGGRVYFTSTDQKGDFRIGDLFRVEQSTGVATLNADAFDLSGLSQLQLGSIGAELGATINEFSTDETLSNDSNSAVPTERAVKGHLTRDKMGTGAFVPPTGTTSERPTGGNLYTGALRYNSSLTTWEGYNGSAWTGLGGGNPWQTFTADGSTTLTVASNDRYFINTNGNAATVNLPSSPLVGDSVSLVDLAGVFGTYNLTVGRNGKQIQDADANLVLDVDYTGITLVFSGDTYGWILVNN
jgi:hypothetical protein